ncbi:MAG: hypothetical protein Q7T33_12275 [Dehalococcoidia bacterium]|nr:hypothetical protein [Dehalococcoidia bacterium]
MKSTQKKQNKIQAESHRRTLQVLQDEKFMEGVYEAMAEAAKGERGVPAKELKRKYKRA